MGNDWFAIDRSHFNQRLRLKKNSSFFTDLKSLGSEVVCGKCSHSIDNTTVFSSSLFWTYSSISISITKILTNPYLTALILSPFMEDFPIELKRLLSYILKNNLDTDSKYEEFLDENNEGINY